MLLVLVAVLGLAALGIEWWPGRDTATLPSAPPLFVGFVLVAFGACCVALGALWAALRSREALHELRQREAAFARVGGAWLWQTDAEHRLVALRPPADADNASWARQPAGRPPIWQHFAGEAATEDGLALAARMHERVALERVSLRAGAQRWAFSGAPHTDAAGRFTGYYGLAWPMAEHDRMHTEAALLHALSQQLACPLVEIGEDAGGHWRVLRSNDAAARLLPAPAPTGPAAPPSPLPSPSPSAEPEPTATAALAGSSSAPAPAPTAWPEFAAAWPAPLRDAIARLDPGHGAEAAGWRARWIDVPSAGEARGPARRLLLLEPQAGGAEAAARAAAEEADAFIYSVSHDLRAPIRVIDGFARILKEDHGSLLDRIGNDHVDRVIGAAQRMHHMIDALLALSRLAVQPLARQRVDLSQLAHFVLDDLVREAPDRGREFDIEPGIVAQGDPALLRVVLENLLGNAWKYSQRSPVARISLRREEARGRPAVVVADNGAGFDMRFADRLFGVFQRLHSAADFAGTGIGLASTRRILARHGSEIWADAEVGQGARFHFTLP